MPEIETSFAALASDYWKLLRSFERIAASAPADRLDRLLAQSRFAGSRLREHLDAVGMEIVTFEGQEITPTIPVVAINADECGNFKRTVVASTIDPAVVSKGRVLIPARVIAAEGDQ